MIERGASAVAALTVACALSSAAVPARAGAQEAVDSKTGWIVHQAPAANPSEVYQWVLILQEASARSVERFSPRPPIISREMFIVLSSMYDAWAAYDDRAVGTRLDRSLRRPPAERTLQNKERAIAYAAYRALLAVYPEDEAWLSEQMRSQGHDPQDESRDPTTAQGIGNLAAQAVLAHRLHDGSNQLGDEPGSSGEPYSDYTYYEPRNPDDRIVEPGRWQRLPFEDGKGGVYYPDFLAAHWYRVEPFALTRSDQFRPGPPPQVGSEELKREVDECIAVNGHLSHMDKTIVEFMRDGPRSTGQSGHWLHFAADISRRDGYGLDQDIKLFFTVAGTVFDAFIASWDTKRHYDTSRPWTLVRHYYGEQEIEAYLGPCKGFGKIPASQWHPYSPATFVTPPFPGYTSGHAAASGGASKIMELFTGSDRFEVVALRNCGELTETQCSVAQMQARNGVPAADVPAERELRLELPTLSATAEMAARSRMLGGYHIATDNLVGLQQGRAVAEYSWPVYRSYFEGTAAPVPPAQPLLERAAGH